ncbi:MAG: DegT/DnrJ/EryC1/StrS family aminotransferase [Elusimicrobia bacterium]|nr:DegT/DnrJ/EryC1/StrS family aminotransferase [Elusimicrobiota bacterium]
MKVEFYGHVRQYHGIKKEIDAAISSVLESGKYVMGPALSKFEGELASYCGTKYVVGLNSGTDALWLVLLALGIGEGDEVITTSNTFFATAEAIWFVNAKPVFVEMDPKTYNIDVTKIEEKITSRTKAIIPVHLYGQPADMKAIAGIAKKHNLKVIEDNAQGLGSKGDTFRIGELSDAMCTSFIIQKNLGTFGDGGAVATNNPQITERIKALRNHGSLKRSVHSMGYNSRLDDIHAAVLSVKLKQLDKWSQKRREIAKRYDSELKNTGLELPFCKPGYSHVYHLYVIHTDKRDDLQKYLENEGITALTHYPIPIHKQEGYPWGKHADMNISLPLTERSANRLLSLPMFPELTDDEVSYTIEAIKRWRK